jgi:predicted transcriptional regulator
MPTKESMTVSEIAEMFGVSEQTVRNWEKQANGPRRIEGVSPVTFRTDDILDFAQEEQIVRPGVLESDEPEQKLAIDVENVTPEQIDNACIAAGFSVNNYGQATAKETREIAVKWLEAWQKVLTEK